LDEECLYLTSDMCYFYYCGQVFSLPIQYHSFYTYICQ